MTTPAVPLDLVLSDANTLFGWMGRFWTEVYRDPDFVKSCMVGKGMMASQLAITGEETRRLVDRRNLPVMHRERWFPITIRESEQGRGGAAMFRLGATPTPVLGPQNPGIFMTGRVFQLGGYVRFSDITVYPVDANIAGIMTLLSDSPDNPTQTWTPADFALQHGSVVFRREQDPFTYGTPQITVELNDDGTVKDRTVTLWGMDTAFDWQYVALHLGYVLGLNTVPSTDYFKRLINAMWDSLTGSATLDNTEALAAAVYDVPVAVSSEPVVSILTQYDGTVLIVTATQAYQVVDPDPNIVVGTVLRRGQPLTSAIQLFSNIYNPSTLGYAFRSAVPAVTFPRSFFSAPLNHGLTATWDQVPVVVDGFDQNGNPRLRFELGGDPVDEQAFWEYFWLQCEIAGVSSRACFVGWIDDIVVATDGAVLGYLSPLDYVFKMLVGANCAFLAVDRTKLSALGLEAATAGRIGLIHDTIPANIHLFIIEHQTAPTEQYTLTDETDATYAEQITKYAGATAYSTMTAGTPAGGRAAYKDYGVKYRWVSVCK